MAAVTIVSGNKHPETRRHRVVRGVSTGLALLACILSIAGGWTRAQTGGQATAGKSPVSGTWAEVDRLISEQKFETAATAVAGIRAAAQKSGDQPEWTRALIREVQLRTGLHGYETAVRFLKEQPWPNNPVQRSVLNLFYALSLANYTQAYSYEVSQRERVESGNGVDLRAWTKDQIYSEAQKAYYEVWGMRATQGAESLSRVSEYLQRGSYPREVRGTIRDIVSYLYVELLADTSFWRPEEINDVWRLDAKKILGGETAAGLPDAALLDGSIHPLKKIGAILSDLENWHSDAGRREAALEARLELVRRLHGSISDVASRQVIREDLEGRLPSFRDVPWWAAGMATLAGLVREEEGARKLVRARAVALEGYEAYPTSTGGRLCLHILRSIEAPDFNVNSMASDGIRRRSIEVSHKNTAKIYFRAFPVDLEKRIGSVHDYNLLPGQVEQTNLIKTARPAAEWSIDLPPTPDYETHKTFVAPPINAPGLYVVATSAGPDFSNAPGNKVVAVNLIVSGLVLESHADSASGSEVRIYNGDSGKPVTGATAALYRYDWQTHHQKVEEELTDEQGLVRFTRTGPRGNASYFLFARNGADIALNSRFLYFGELPRETESEASLIYTDRSIYRPLQKVLWKVVVFRGWSGRAEFQTSPSTDATVSLVDLNGQKIE